MAGPKEKATAGRKPAAGAVSPPGGISPFGKKPPRTFILLIAMPALLIYVATSALALGGLMLMASEINRHDDERTTGVIHAVLDNFLGALADAVSDEGAWDEAYLNAVVAPDPAWLDGTWGTTARAGLTYDNVIVTDADGTIVFGEDNIGAIKGNIAARFPVAAEVLARLDAEIAAGGDAATVSTYADDESGMAGLAAVSIHRASPGEITVPRNTRRVLWIAKHLTSDTLVGFSETFGVPLLSVVEMPTDGQSAVPIGDITGRLLGSFAWEPERPGDRALVHALLIASSLLAVVGVALLIGLSALRRAFLKRAAVIDATLEAARRDPATGQLTRFGFLDGLNGLLAKTSKPRHLSVAWLGVDNYENVRETHGSDVADGMMKLIGQLLARDVGTEVLLGRVADNGFAIGTAGPKSEATVKRLTDLISEHPGTPLSVRAHSVDPRLTIGISTGPGMPAPASLRSAEAAMREARDGGESRTVTYVMADEGKRRERIETTRRLRAAIRDNQFELEYQPFFDLRGETLIGVEALLRWRRDDGTLEPAEFLATAEAAGLMSEIGLIALRRAAAEILPFKGLLLGFNVGMGQFFHPDFAGQLGATLDASGFPKTRLQLEMDQSLLAGQPEKARSVIDALRAEGIIMALDDFVVGQSSIGYLRQFALDRVKLARSLISGVDTDATKLALVETTVRIARGSGLAITALGVERKEEVAKLLRLGCTEFQGFLFARPMSLEGLTRLVVTPEKTEIRQAG
ncbi:MAG: EAL domain-containing protein [Devosia sp.]